MFFRAFLVKEGHENASVLVWQLYMSNSLPLQRGHWQVEHQNQGCLMLVGSMQDLQLE